MAENVEKEIMSIISDVAEVDTEEITLDSDLVKDLGINSIKAIEVVVALEKKYKISIRDEDVPKITTPRQIITLTENLITKRAM